MLSKDELTLAFLLSSFATLLWVLLLSVGFRIRGIKMTDEYLLPFFL
jgi:hypothetical protein